MTPSGTAPAHHRIVIGASCYADAMRAIPLAAILASWAKSDLRGVLVEDTQTLVIAELPFSRGVTAAGTRVASVTRQQIELSLSGDARAFQTDLARRAKEGLRDWTFETLHGEVMAQTLAAADQGDIVLIGHRRLHEHIGPIAWLCDPDQTTRRSFDIAAALARNLQTPLAVYVVAPPQGAPDQAMATVETLVRRAGLRGSTVRAFGTTSDLLAALNRSNCSAVVVDLAAGPLRSAADLAALRDNARCSLVILGAVADLS
ncbi:hypothetical protein [Pseudogemmobacter sp. W21_MBD1_M6]|uniref:hypothetical protein n=1 Tax=Pseudogemmobacter sp. W21_MBD1_M6 TaxID=3240271 RepID=UPI003F96369F